MLDFIFFVNFSLYLFLQQTISIYFLVILLENSVISFKFDSFSFYLLINLSDLMIFRKNKLFIRIWTSCQRSWLIDISIVCYAFAWERSIRVISNFLSYLYRWTNYEVTKSIIDRISNIFREINELISNFC